MTRIYIIIYLCNFIFKKGNNSIRIAFAYSSGENVDCLIKVYGSVENRLIGRFLLPIGGDYYSFSDGDYFSVYKVGESLPQVALYGVSSAAARYLGRLAPAQREPWVVDWFSPANSWPPTSKGTPASAATSPSPVASM